MSRIFLIALLCLGGCATNLGAGAVPEARQHYNEAIARSANDQLLLNLVRLRYRDPINFLNVDSVLTQYSFSGSAAAGAGLDDGLGFTGGSLSSGVAYSEDPVVSYSPLQGSDYARELLTPIASDTLFLLMESGWSAERLMLCCVDRIEDLTNARSALGPTPERIPDNREFLALAQLMRRLQQDDVLTIDLMQEGEALSAVMILDSDQSLTAAQSSDLDQFRSTLGLSAEHDRFRIVTTYGEHEADNTLLVRGRSMLGILYALSHSVDVPGDHASAGWVTQSRSSSDGLTDWRSVLNGTFGVSSSSSRPGDAFTAVRYRGQWFYIPDNDLNAKSTFSLLGHLIALQSGVQAGSENRALIAIGG